MYMAHLAALVVSSTTRVLPSGTIVVASDTAEDRGKSPLLERAA